MKIFAPYPLQIHLQLHLAIYHPMALSQLFQERDVLFLEPMANICILYPPKSTQPLYEQIFLHVESVHNHSYNKAISTVL